MKVTFRSIQRWLKPLKDEDKIDFKGSPKTGGYVVHEWFFNRRTINKWA